MEGWQHIGEAIRYYRALHGWSQRDLAAKAGISPGSIVRLETGEIRNPRLGTVHDLEEALGIYGELLPFIISAPTMPNPSMERSDHAESAGAGPFMAVFQRDGDWWIGYVEELPGANAQERTLEEARESLRAAVSDILEANRELTRTEFEGRDVVREPLNV